MRIVDVEPYTVPGTVSVIVKVTRDGGHPVRDARVRFAGKAANGGRTGNQGLAQVFAPVDLPGYFSAYARKGNAVLVVHYHDRTGADKKDVEEYRELFVGYFADWQKERGLEGREQWDPIFWVYIAVLLCAAVAWWAYRLTPLADEQTTDRA